MSNQYLTQTYEGVILGILAGTTSTLFVSFITDGNLLYSLFAGIIIGFCGGMLGGIRVATFTGLISVLLGGLMVTLTKVSIMFRLISENLSMIEAAKLVGIEGPVTMFMSATIMFGLALITVLANTPTFFPKKNVEKIIIS